MSSPPAGFDTDIGQKQFDDADQDQQIRRISQIFILDRLDLIAAGEHGHGKYRPDDSQHQPSQDCVQHMQPFAAHFREKQICQLFENQKQIACPDPHRDQEDRPRPVQGVHGRILQMGNRQPGSQKPVQQDINDQPHDPSCHPGRNRFRPFPDNLSLIINNAGRRAGQPSGHFPEHFPPGNVRVIANHCLHLLPGHAKLVHGPETEP